MKRWIFLGMLLLASVSYAQNKVAIFAGGCFWCMQSDFDKLPGVLATYVGYDGGYSKNPTYKKVSAGKTRYAESIKVVYDSQKINYPALLTYFWHNIDPTVKDAQFCDKGPQYRAAIFYLNGKQKQQALASLKEVEQHIKPVYTEILPSTYFYLAEKNHQDYYKKNAVRYHYYRWNCGRDKRLKEVWGEARKK